MGVVNLVATGRDASDHLIRNSGIDKVTSTGSTMAGERIGVQRPVSLTRP
ncbi:aldehyde dehydrogenase family protein [Sphingobium sp. CR2-8]